MKNNFSTYYSNEGSLIWGGYFLDNFVMAKGGQAGGDSSIAPVIDADVNGRGGLIVGDSHKDGGVPFVLEDSGTHIEEEGEEANLPNEIKDITKVYTFKGKNHEVIHKILQLVGLKLSNKVTSVRSGDLVICKDSLWDDTIRSYTGTPIQIVSAVNESEGCNHIESGATMIENGKKVEMGKGGRIPIRYKEMGFNHVGQKKKSTRPEKKWMVLAKKGDKYKVVHGGYKGMKDFSQHHDSERRKRFWKRMGGEDSSKARDPFSPLYWHRRLGTWGKGGILEDGTVKVAWIDSDTPDIMESKMYDDLSTALEESKGKTFMVMGLEESEGDYYKWKMLPYGMYDKFQKVLDWSGIFNR